MNKTTEALKLPEEALLESGYYDTTQQRKALAAIREARAEQAEQKPVAEVVLRKQTVGFGRTEERKDVMFLADVEVGQKLYAAPQPMKQEPVVKIHKYNEFQTLGSLNLPIGTKLYAAPVRTKDLTDDEIMKINVDTAGIVPTCDRQFHFARAVIDADREKNK